MYFYIPTKIFSEDKCIEKNADYLSRYSGKALIVTGRSSAYKTGALDDVITALDKNGISHCIFDQVTENPTDTIVNEIAEIGKAEGVALVVGIGGGSPIDAAKSASVLIANPQCGKELLVNRIDVPHIPVIAVPTTAGTGTEATPYASIIITETGEKRGTAHRVFPDVAFVDTRYLRVVPMKVFNNTIVDSLGHLIESKLNRKANAYSNMLCDYGLRIWGDSAKELFSDIQTTKEHQSSYGNRLSDKSYENFSVASTVAGMAISHAGTAIPHGISNCLTYDYGIPHGQAVGVFLTAYLRNMPDPKLSDEVLKLIGISDLNDFEEKLGTILDPVKINSADKTRYINMMICSKARNCPYIETQEVLTDFFENNKLITIE